MILLEKLVKDIEEVKTLLISHIKSAPETRQGDNEQPELLTAKETMSLLRINRNTFIKWRKLGYLKVYNMGGKRIYCKYSEIMESLEHGLLERA